MTIKPLLTSTVHELLRLKLETDKIELFNEIVIKLISH
jgi:hypothetical protein